MATQDTILSILTTLLQMPLPFSLRDDAEALKSLAEQYAAQRTELPDSQHYRLRHRCPAERGHESVWAVIYRKSEFMSEVQIGARLCRADACALAWEHRANPELFEASDDRAAALLVEAAKTIDSLRHGRGG